ncbi:MAG TPA: D-alanine--D-alanine ligase [Thermoanaerobaculia bacterium]|nr:D-alanine--D-alanine ligase [Thermoanaerobaculia bacterium]
MKRKLRVIALVHPSLLPPDTIEGLSEQQWYECKTEYDVVSTLRALGHDVKPLGLSDDLEPLRALVQEWRPDLVFNLLEEFLGRQDFDAHIVTFLELLRVPYTGCHPRGLMLARDKAISKQILAWHGVTVPRFAVFPRKERVVRPKELPFPLIVKGLTCEASLGISQKSVVDSDAKLRERVQFIHDHNGTAAIAEQYIAGRELNVGVIGNRTLEVLPVWELQFRELAPGAYGIATAHAKHNRAYQRKHSIYQVHAEDLGESLTEHITETTRQVARALDLTGYSRVDYRLDANGTLYFLEANPNPDIARAEELASAARKRGISYEELIQRIVALGLQR